MSYKETDLICITFVQYCVGGVSRTKKGGGGASLRDIKEAIN